jgi:rubredoxin
MDKYKCVICGYIYDEEEGDTSGGIDPGVPFNDLPSDF